MFTFVLRLDGICFGLVTSQACFWVDGHILLIQSDTFGRYVYFVELCELLIESECKFPSLEVLFLC